MNKIGLLVDVTSDNKISINFPYFRFAEQFGAVTLVHPYESEIIPDLDLLIIPGGQDVHPLRYGQVKVPWLCQGQNANFEYWDLAAMPKYIENKTPIYGICRGLQSINVHFGGTLHQHIYNEPTSNPDERGQLVHYVQDTRTQEVMKTNGHHHQAIDKLGDGLEVLLEGFKVVKKKGKVKLQIEAVKHTELPIICGQMHVEEMDSTDDNSRPLVEWTLSEIYEIMEQGKSIRAAQQIALAEVVEDPLSM